MSLVEHPASDFALGDGVPERAIAQLLGRDIQQRHIPRSHPPQNISALRRREQPIQSGREWSARAAHQSVHLILQERL
jgi:hypothetical protein